VSQPDFAFTAQLGVRGVFILVRAMRWAKVRLDFGISTRG
jgi:hypothetical protein